MKRFEEFTKQELETLKDKFVGSGILCEIFTREPKIILKDGTIVYLEGVQE